MIAKTKFRDKSNNLIIKEGDRIAWENNLGEQFAGMIINMESDIAIVELPNGQKKAIRC